MKGLEVRKSKLLREAGSGGIPQRIFVGNCFPLQVSDGIPWWNLWSC